LFNVALNFALRAFFLASFSLQDSTACCLVKSLQILAAILDVIYLLGTTFECEKIALGSCFGFFDCSLLFLFGMVGDTCVLVDFSLSEQRGILVWHSKQFFCSFYKQRFMGMLVLFRDKFKPKVGNRIMAIKTENDRMF